jgi:hypothetical protein
MWRKRGASCEGGGIGKDADADEQQVEFAGVT